MIANTEIWRAAFSLIEEHGAGAEFVAAQRVDEFYLKEDRDEYKVWKRIRKAIFELDSLPPRAH